MIHSFVTERVLIRYVYRRPPPMYQFLALVLVGCIKLSLTSKPKFVTVEEFQTTLHIVENGIVDVIKRLVQAE